MEDTFIEDGTPEITHDLEGLDRLNQIAQKSHNGVVQNDPESDVRWKQFRFKVEKVEDDGTFWGYASVWGIKDSDNEVVDKGSCLRSLKNNPNFTLLWMHDTKTPIGFAVEAFEDDYGVKLKGQIALDCDMGRYAYAMLKLAKKVGGTAKMGLSIGFRAITKKWVEDPKTKQSILHFTEISLMETSVVTFAANYAAYVTSVKSAFLQAPPSGENTESTREKAMDKKAVDFDSSLSDLQRQRALAKHRNDIEDARYNTISAIHGSTEHDTEAKKALIKDCYMKYASAMSDWHVQSYFGDHAKSFDGSLYRKSEDSTGLEQKAEATDDGGSLLTKSKGKMSAAAKASMTHALDLHSSALDLHGKAMRIVKDMFGDDSASETPGSDTGTEMGAMGDDKPVEQKEEQRESLEEKTSSDPEGIETKAEATAQSEGKDTPQEADGDSGIHSLAEELAALTKSRLESLSNG